MRKQLNKFYILVDLGYRIAKIKTYARTKSEAILRVFKRFSFKQPDFQAYFPLTTNNI